MQEGPAATGREPSGTALAVAGAAIDADVVVIGAGQAGLAAAYHLQRVGLVPVGRSLVGARPASAPARTFVVLDDAPAPGGAWQHPRPGLTMATADGLPDLPGTPLHRSRPDASASTVVPAYFADYERELDLCVRRPVHVRAVRDLGGPDGVLTVETVETVEPAGSGESSTSRASTSRARTWRTRAVVSATGTWSKPFWPAYPGRERFAGRQLHERDVRSVDELAGQRVMVVGGGTSALRLLHEVARVATTTWVTRRPRPEHDDVELATEHRAGLESGELVPRPLFTRLVPRGAVWTVGSVPDGEPTHVRADVIIWATGFRAALDHLAPLHLRAHGGEIVMDGTQATADPRIQLVGYGPSTSTTGVDRAGREAVRNLRRTLGL